MNTLLHEGLMRTKNLSHAAIIKRKGHAIKAKSHAFQLTLEEIKQLDACFASFQEIRTTSEPAVTVMHIPYKAIRCDEYSFYGKNDSNNVGIVVARTSSYYILGLFDANMHPSIATEAVERLADYFRNKEKI